MMSSYSTIWSTTPSDSPADAIYSFPSTSLCYVCPLPHALLTTTKSTPSPHPSPTTPQNYSSSTSVSPPAHQPSDHRAWPHGNSLNWKTSHPPQPASALWRPVPGGPRESRRMRVEACGSGSRRWRRPRDGRRQWFRRRGRWPGGCSRWFGRWRSQFPSLRNPFCFKSNVSSKLWDVPV